ncbi:TetR/AcrR family transcriptional regulator [Desulfogranum japonicum]|uniref:TetR/AcrR family transcriptional regulator n=1 Tax=Desulfogranum japonicum TaxID=231447 RepID=UPI00042337A1|nr:TetR/AcrR family transcriptional regulator [Desulfogranum japonicum]
MNNQAKILSSALELFALHGYDAVGVQSIVAAAKVTKPTLYHYFGSKKGLLLALLENKFGELFQLLEEATAKNGNLQESLSRVVSAYFHFAKKNPVFYRLQLSMWFAPVHSEAFKVALGFSLRQQELLEKLFIDAAEQNQSMKEQHQTYAATFLGMTNTYIGISLNGYVELNQSLIDRTVHQFLYGIFAKDHR